MPIIIAYITVIIIWSTTPLAIQWSGEGISYSFGVALRMCIGLLLLLAIIAVKKLSFPWHKRARQVYYAGGLSLFAAMSLVYWSAQYIPSGWIAVIFGLSPLFTSMWSALIYKQNVFSKEKLIGMLLGLGGLSIIFIDSLSLADYAWMGLIGVIFSALSQSLGAVIIAQLKVTEVPALSITSGSLIIAIPGFIISSLLQGGIPATIPDDTLYAIIYLAIFGTAIGFPLYYYLLKHLPAERIALVTLITPVSALMVGDILNNEIISTKIWIGTALIITGLIAYDYKKLTMLLRPMSSRS